ncbi:alpha/beta fold hydrolase [Mycolicibacterium frederiksbergense]|uniref:Alpha/beta hydrolase n=1 Tax=Mycolicibacterium frederiksbergense TaxID=117567 RepID=A0A6H0S0M9_9MYCO|nr:alpha/beta hydrolase [Mycolicibacterium frederiksbergense]QIV80760.1 alpha/beta hydrolase [Mycolicibacterium frederiksbergense]
MTPPRLVAEPDIIATGTGSPLVLAHGAGGSVGANFGQVIDTLSATRRLIGLNYPGSGSTPEAPDALELTVLADSLVAAAVEAGFDRFPILGLSLGTAVAVTAAVRHPDRVTGLLLTVGFARSDQQLRLVVDTWTTLAHSGDHATLAGYLVSLSSPTVLGGLDRQAADAAVAMTLEHYPAGGADQARLAASVDTRAACGAIGVPTVVFAGGQDRIVLPQTTRHLAAAIPGATLIEYADAGHIFTTDEASSWIDDIRDFLRVHQL